MKLEYKDIQEFKGSINGVIVNNYVVYWSCISILSEMEEYGYKLTKKFIRDFVKNFQNIYSYDCELEHTISEEIRRFGVVKNKQEMEQVFEKLTSFDFLDVLID